MSRGPGAIEARIAELLAATRDRALDIGEITDHAFALAGAAPTRAQRLSATRATHRLLRRVRETHQRARDLMRQAHANTKAALGRDKREERDRLDEEYWDRLKADPAHAESFRLHDYCERIGRWCRHLRVEGKPGWMRVEDDYWCVITLRGRLYLHPPDAPMRVWAVSIQPARVVWAEAEVVKITSRNVMVRYAGELARLDRKSLWYWWAF